MRNRLIIIRHNDCELIRGLGGNSLPEHTHKSFTLVLIKRGSLIISLNGTDYSAKAGTAVILPPDNSISLNAVGIYAYESLSVHRQMCGRIMAYLSDRPVLFKDPGFIGELFRSFKDMSSEDDFIDRLGGFLQNYVTVERNEKDTSGVVKKATDYIENHIRDGISITDVATSLHVTTGYLARAFKKAMKITPKQYLIQCRLREARKELEDNVSCADIAYETGFSSQSHFCTVFKKYMGISASDYTGIINQKNGW